MISTRILLVMGVVVTMFSALAISAAAVELGQVDDFEDGTVQDWVVSLLGAPHPAPPENIPTGGPGGDEDNYMLVTAVGEFGPGSRLAVINGEQWAGDYLAANVARITMDLSNFSETDLYIRILFEDRTDFPPANIATTEAVFVPANSGWMEAEFRVGAEDLILIQGDVNTLLANTTMIRIFHNSEPDFPPPPVVAQLGVDNVRALPDATPVEAASWGRVKNRFH